MNPDRILIAQIGAAHGVRGEVRVKSFSADPQALRTYRDLLAEDGRTFAVERFRPARDVLVVKFKGVPDRDAAEALNGTRLYMDRKSLPAPEDGEFYHADLIGLVALDPAGQAIGKVAGVHDFGAGDIIEIAPDRGATIMVPFTLASVPEIDLRAGTLTIVPADEVEARGDEESG